MSNVFKRKVLASNSPGDSEIPSKYNQGIRKVTASTDSRDWYNAELKTTHQLTDEMNVCYRRETSGETGPRGGPNADQSFCVPDLINIGSCQQCFDDIEDPPGSGCRVGDDTCANNYMNSPVAGGSRAQ